MSGKQVLKRVEEVILPIVSEEGFELLDLLLTGDMGRTILRVVIDKKDRRGGGITVNDCARLSHAIEDLLEVEGCIPCRYDLQVSSPGVDRPLKKREHFLSVIGHMVKIQTVVSLEGRRHYKGVLKAVLERDLLVEIDRKDYLIPFEKIGKANLAYLK